MQSVPQGSAGAPPSIGPGLGSPSPAPGGPRVDEMLDAVRSDLDLVGGLPPADQVPVYNRIHTVLTTALATTAAGTDPTSTPGAVAGQAATARPGGVPARPGPGIPGGR